MVVYVWIVLFVKVDLIGPPGRGIWTIDEHSRALKSFAAQTTNHFHTNPQSQTQTPLTTPRYPVSRLSATTNTMQRTTLRLPRQLSRRALPSYRPYTTTPRHSSSNSPFGSGPAPPRLPKEEQEIFERLQRQSTGAFSTPRPDHPTPSAPSSNSTADLRMRINQSPDSASSSAAEQQGSGRQVEIRVEGEGRIPQGEEVHPNMRRGAPPEFEGDVNPKTGEVGGPKNEPLRWGSSSDWSFNGRVTDF